MTSANLDAYTGERFVTALVPCRAVSHLRHPPPALTHVLAGTVFGWALHQRQNGRTSINASCAFAAEATSFVALASISAAVIPAANNAEPEPASVNSLSNS